MMNNILFLRDYCYDYMALHGFIFFYLFFLKSYNQTLRNVYDLSWLFFETVSRKKCSSIEKNDITQGRTFAYAVDCDPGTHKIKCRNEGMFYRKASTFKTITITLISFLWPSVKVKSDFSHEIFVFNIK